MQQLDLAPQLGATLTRLGQGVRARYYVQQPIRPVKLYDIENCPFCRLVRDVLTEIDLDVVIYPCPKGGGRYRSLVKEQGGREQFPWLVDENTGAELYESGQIIRYLFETYVYISLPLRWRLRWLQVASSCLSSSFRVGHGTSLSSSAREPEQLLTLYSFEASPFARRVREVLCEMELPYQLKNVGRAGWRDWVLPRMREKFSISSQSAQRNRNYLQAQYGYVTVPFLEDANTGESLGQSDDIIKYLRKQYG